MALGVDLFPKGLRSEQSRPAAWPALGPDVGQSAWPHGHQEIPQLAAGAGTAHLQVGL